MVSSPVRVVTVGAACGGRCWQYRALGNAMGDGSGKSFAPEKLLELDFFRQALRPIGPSAATTPWSEAGTLLAYGTRNSPQRLNIEHDTLPSTLY